MSKENEVIEDVDDFLTIPDADSVLSVPDENAKAMFSRGGRDVDLDFLDKKEEPATEEEEDTRTVDEKQKDLEDAMSILDEAPEDEEFDVDDEGNKKVDKDSLAGVFQALIKDELITPFDDDKDLADYSTKDFKELIKANIDAKVVSARNETPKQFFESLPDELQYAAMHVAKGNTDLKSVFKALAEREEVKELDVNNENHLETIARQYLQATDYGSGDTDIIEDQIQDWIESGDINKKAKQFKPKLDKMQEKILEGKLKKQEEFQAAQTEKRKTYVGDVYSALEKGELNGVKINNKTQNFLYNELTTTKYESMSGKPTNLLGKLLEDHQYGETPRMDLIAEATWLLSNPEEYKDQLMKKASSAANLETAKKLKTEEGRKLKTTTTITNDNEKIKNPKKSNTIRRQKNIFGK